MLTETAVPYDASDSSAVWSVKNAGAAGASIPRNTLSASGAGILSDRVLPSGDVTADVLLSARMRESCIDAGGGNGSVLQGAYRRET